MQRMSRKGPPPPNSSLSDLAGTPESMGHGHGWGSHCPQGNWVNILAGSTSSLIDSLEVCSTVKPAVKPEAVKPSSCRFASSTVIWKISLLLCLESLPSLHALTVFPVTALCWWDSVSEVGMLAGKWAVTSLDLSSGAALFMGSNLPQP